MDRDTLKTLRALAHHLKPVIWIGQNGYTENVATEINRALEHHQLVKVRSNGQDRDNRKTMAEAIAEDQQADVVQTIGATLTLYRRNPEKDTLLA